MSNRGIAKGAATLLLLTLSGCMVGPTYKTPSAALAPAFKEAPPASFTAQDGWKPGQPSDSQLKGDWWTMFGDQPLNELEAQVNGANQSIKSAEANFRAARAQIGVAKSFEAPTIGVGPSINSVRDSANQPYFSRTLANNGVGNFSLPVDLNYEVDLWGRIRRGVTLPLGNRRRPAILIWRMCGSACMQNWLWTILVCGSTMRRRGCWTTR